MGGLISGGFGKNKKQRRDFLIAGVAIGAGALAVAAIGLSAQNSPGPNNLNLSVPKIPYTASTSSQPGFKDSAMQYVAADPSLSPTSNNAVDLGDLLLRWRTLFSVTVNSGSASIIPLTDVVGLIAKGFPGGVSDVAQIFDSTSPTQVKRWFFDNNGNLILRISPTGATTARLKIQNDNLTLVHSILWQDISGVVRVFDFATDSGTNVARVDGDWRVNGDNRGNTFSDFTSGNVLMFKGSVLFEGVTYSGVQLGGNIIGQNVILSSFGSAILNVGLVPFIAFIVEQRTADPSNLTQGRLWARTDLSPKRLKYSLDGTILKLLAYTDDSISQFTGAIAQSQAFPGTVVDINNDQTVSSITVPSTDTAIKTFSLTANSFSKVRTSVDGFISVFAKATLQMISLKIFYGAVQIGQIMKFQAPSAVASIFPFSFQVEALQQAAVTVSVTAGAPAADTLTIVQVSRMTVEGVV